MTVASVTRPHRRAHAGRSPWVRRWLSLSAIAAMTMSVATVDAADAAKVQCLEANTRGQDLRREGHLSLASEQFRWCATAACPALVHDDCARRLDELERSQPSLVLDVKDASGADLVDVRVAVDGQPLADHLDGLALKVDPGEHILTFKVSRSPVVTLPVVIREGEKSRHERVLIASIQVSTVRPETTAAPEPGSEAAKLAPGGTPARGFTTGQAVALSLAGGGAVGLGLGGVFGARAITAWNNAKTACGGNPSQCRDAFRASSYHDEAETDGWVSTIGFIGGGALLVGGFALYFHVRNERDAGSPSVALAPSAGPGQAGLVMHGSFW